MTARDFVAGLLAHFARTQEVPRQAELDYWRWIRRNHVSECELERIYDRILESARYFPPIVELTDHLSAFRRADPKEVSWQTFTLGQYRLARKVNPADLPELPGEGHEGRLLVGRSLQYEDHRCSIAEARQAFREGFIKAGGKAERMDEFFNALAGGCKR